MDPSVVSAAMEDVDSAPLDDRQRAAVRFLEKLTRRPDDVGADDVRALREAGLTRQAIEEVALVCFAFNVIDRLANAFGFDVPAPKYQRRVAWMLYRMGYARAIV